MKDQEPISFDAAEAACLVSALGVAIKHVVHEAAMSREPDDSKVEFLEGMNDLREKLNSHLAKL